MKFVEPLENFGRDDVTAAGGKGANLGELVRAGLSVPAGIVITTSISVPNLNSRKKIPTLTVRTPHRTPAGRQ